LLDGGTDPPEADHVHHQVERPVVEEGGGDEAPPVARGNEWAVERALGVDPVPGPVDVAAEGELQEVDADVDPDERLRDDGAGALEARSAHPLRDPRGALRLAGMVGAADPDGREDHAIRADRPAALRAGDHRLPVGVPIAVHRFGGGGHGAAVA
jgi:hypothetical protein